MGICSFAVVTSLFGLGIDKYERIYVKLMLINDDDAESVYFGCAIMEVALVTLLFKFLERDNINSIDRSIKT